MRDILKTTWAALSDECFKSFVTHLIVAGVLITIFYILAQSIDITDETVDPPGQTTEEIAP